MNSSSGTFVIVGLIVLAVAVGVIAMWRMHEGDTELSDSFAYDLDPLRQTDSSLILYDETSTIKTSFQEARGIAFDTLGKFYIAGDQSVRQFSAEGKSLSEIRLKAAPYCLAATQDQLYIGAEDHIMVYSVQGELIAEWESLGEKSRLTSIAVAEKDVFVADAGNRIVWRFDKQGNLLNRIGDRDMERDIVGFVIPSPYFDLALAPDGLLRVVNPGKHRVEAYTFDGDLAIYWGEYSSGIKGFCGCCNPVNFAMFADGSYVTAEKGLTRVKIYEANGTFSGVVAGPEAFVSTGHACEESSDCQTGGLDVAVDSTGRVFVLDTLTGDVRIFSKKEPERLTQL